MPAANIDVFISYSQDSPDHKARVLALADRLRDEGIETVIDRYQTAPPEGWPLWMEKQIRDAKFVLLVCTETYLRRVMKEEAPGKGLGVLWESTIINSYLYESGGVNEKFIPIVFDYSDTQFIPRPLKPTTYYDVSSDDGYELLHSRLTDQPLTPAPALGRRRVKSSSSRAASTSSRPPTNTLPPNLVHPYGLQANFTGRVREREELTAWLADDAQSICALIAMGGMGKSALAWYWVKNDVLTAAQASSAFAVDGVMWWSFYEGESSFAKFIDEAFKYASNQPTIDAELFPTTYDRAQELRKQLQTKRVLFVLDGFERQLRAYARLDAAYKPDDITEPSREERACVDPIAARWLSAIAAGTTRAKMLLTTRLMAHDLEDRAGDALAGVLKRELKELPRDDAVKFMRDQGVTKGTPAEIATSCEAYGYHPLSLRLLSGLIARDARTPGDIAAAPHHDVHANLIQRQHHVLEQSYDVLPEKERALLSRIAAFRSPMVYDALAIFNDFGGEAEFDDALDGLQEHGLLQRETNKDRYDMHPIVRRYAYERLADKADVHARLRDYFAKVPMPDENEVKSIEDLAFVIELYHHTTSAGQYDEALELYRERLQDLLYFRFGAYQTTIELFRALFPDGEDQPPRLKEKMQGWALAALANSYALFGQPRRAVPLFEQQIAIREKQGDKRNLASGLGNMANMAQMILGKLAAAERNLRRSIELCRETGEDYFEASAHHGLSQLLAYLGIFDQAVLESDAALDIVKKLRASQAIGTIWAFNALRALLMGDAQAALEAAQQARTIAGVDRVERDIIHSEWLFGAALIIEGKSLSAAATHLTEALMRCRRINLVEVEPDILLAWARWHRMKGNMEEAQAYAEESLAIAERCEYRLAQAELHNFLARLALEAGEREAAREHAEIAKDRAWCDGPPHCYKPALDEAEGMLRELGVKE
jgi:tetratricopeptide (TPR) repeat protein